MIFRVVETDNTIMDCHCGVRRESNMSWEYNKYTDAGYSTDEYGERHVLPKLMIMSHWTEEDNT